MRDFRKQYQGVFFVGTVLGDGPYPTRLSVYAEDRNPADEDQYEPLDWPDDAWITQATGESVRHWCSGEAQDRYEEIYLPQKENLAEAETLRQAFS